MILDQFNLAGKVAIVTGASTGLGQGMAYHWQKPVQVLMS